MHTEDLEELSVDDLPQMLSGETVDCLLWCCMENERLFLCSMTRSACYLAARMQAYACVTQMFAVQKKACYYGWFLHMLLVLTNSGF